MTESHYSPRRRTALVLTGTGTAGAYHAGVLRALHEAGVKIDLVAGRGIGVVGALFAAVDGGARLWDAAGPWRQNLASRLYGFRLPLRVAGWCVAAGLAALLSSLLLLVGAFGVAVAGLFLTLLGFAPSAARLGTAYAGWVDWALAPPVLPTLLPRLSALGLVAAMLALAAGWLTELARTRHQRRARGAIWWRLAGPLITARPIIDRFVEELWRLVRGAAPPVSPAGAELGRRYTELLLDNLGQPGFRELIAIAHDLDARQDVVFALIRDEHRARFFSADSRVDGHARSAEAIDLGGAGRDHVADALAAALSLPVVVEPRLVTFAPESSWRGETHRLCDRPDAVARLLHEVAVAGAEQVIVVSDAPAGAAPHGLTSGRSDWRGRTGEYLRASEAAALGDALRTATTRFAGTFEIRPSHNPLGPFDGAGAYDERSDRRHDVAELMDRGYEDAYRRFVDPVVGASGDRLEVGPGARRSGDGPVRLEERRP